MCYCDKSEAEIVGDFKRGAIPDEALLRLCCWKKICKVRGERFSEIDEGTWSKLCDKRVQLNAGKSQTGR